MTQIINFIVNGELYYSNQTFKIYDLILYLNYNDSLLVLELNNLICNRKKWKEIFIQNHDKIEIVTIVGGG